MRLSAAVAAFVVTLAFSAAPSAHADNGGAAIALHSSGYRIPVVTVPQADSGALVIYAQTGPAQTGFFAQRVDRRGRPLLGVGGVHLAINDEDAQSLAYLPDGVGGCMMALSMPRGATGYDIVVHRVKPDGTLDFGPSGLVVCNAARDQIDVWLVPGPSGSVLVGWEDDRAAAGSARDIYAQRVDFAGTQHWTANGVPINSTTFRPASGSRAGAVSDFAGGLVIVWDPSASGNASRAQRLNSLGSLQWGAAGVPIGPVDGRVEWLAPDGAGGAWGASSTWDGTYTRYRAHHLLSNGGSAFAAAGIEFILAYQTSATIQFVRNAANGCFAYFIEWSSSTQPYRSVRRLEINASGQLLPATGSEHYANAAEVPNIHDAGNAIYIATGEYLFGSNRPRARVQRTAVDGTPAFPGIGLVVGRDEPLPSLIGITMGSLANGVFTAAWGDGRYTSSEHTLHLQVFGQSFTPQGTPLWDDAEAPIIRTVRDAPGDQGGYVRVTWDASVADHPMVGTLRGYRIWRALPAGAEASLPGPRPAREGAFTLGGRTLLYQANQYWELAGEQPAATLPAYAATATTQQDSTAGSPADEVFMVEAYDDSSHHWFSGTLTGHSVDNLAPGPVPSAAGIYSSGTTTLYWGGVSAPDLCCYEVFRGASPGFVPSAANRIASTVEVSHDDPHGAPAYYRIRARDVHGNVGPSTLVVPSGVADATADGPRAWSLRSRWNGAAGAVDLALDVPEADAGRLELFDVAGRRVWSAPYRTEAARSLLVRATPETELRAGVVYARVVSERGRVLVSKAVVMR